MNISRNVSVSEFWVGVGPVNVGDAGVCIYPPFNVGNTRRGGRDSPAGVVGRCGAGDVVAGCICPGKTSNVDASLFCVLSRVCGDAVCTGAFMDVGAVFTIGRRILRMCGRNIRYIPNMVINITMATDM